MSRLLPALERSTGPQGAGLLVTRSRDADPPDRPITPNARVDVVLGLLSGFAVGVGLGALRDLVDTTLRSPQDLDGIERAVVLGVVPTQPVTGQDRGLSPPAEALRQVRTNLQFATAGGPPRLVVVTRWAPWVSSWVPTPRRWASSSTVRQRNSAATVDRVT